MLRFSLLFIILFFVFSNTVSAVPATPPQTEQEYMDWAKQIWDGLDRQTGKIELPNGVATLTVPEEYYYLNAKDTETVLVEVWGNPPGQNKLGMLFPQGMTPFDDGSWGVTIDYDEDGYVKDHDADEINYNNLLTDMKDMVADSNKERTRLGYEPIQLVGWASTPFYDKSSHKLHWAKELKFGEQGVNTLNYNIRVLGRKGVLVLNFIAGMDQKAMIDSQINNVMAMAEFNSGYKYSEFNPDLDTVAAYGIGGLVAGKVLAKAGMFAALLLFLKKFWIILAVGAAAVLGKIFKRKTV